MLKMGGFKFHEHCMHTITKQMKVAINRKSWKFERVKQLSRRFNLVGRMQASKTFKFFYLLFLCMKIQLSMSSEFFNLSKCTRYQSPKYECVPSRKVSPTFNIFHIFSLVQMKQINTISCSASWEDFKEFNLVVLILSSL